MAGLALFHRNPSEFLHRYIAVDETWIHFYTAEIKEQYKQWTVPGEPDPKQYGENCNNNYSLVQKY